MKAAQQAFATTWGLKATGAARGALLYKLAQLIEDNADAIAAIEALDNGKAAHFARAVDVAGVIACFRYYAGWADKIQGKTMETSEVQLAYTRHEPIGVVGQIIPWNYPGVCLTRQITLRALSMYTDQDNGVCLCSGHALVEACTSARDWQYGCPKAL